MAEVTTFEKIGCGIFDEPFLHVVFLPKAAQQRSQRKISTDNFTASRCVCVW